MLMQSRSVGKPIRELRNNTFFVPKITLGDCLCVSPELFLRNSLKTQRVNFHKWGLFLYTDSEGKLLPAHQHISNGAERKEFTNRFVVLGSQERME